MSEKKARPCAWINNLLADIREPEFIWQVVALLACIGSALLKIRPGGAAVTKKARGA